MKKIYPKSTLSVQLRLTPNFKLFCTCSTSWLMLLAITLYGGHGSSYDLVKKETSIDQQQYRLPIANKHVSKFQLVLGPCNLHVLFVSQAKPTQRFPECYKSIMMQFSSGLIPFAWQ